MSRILGIDFGTKRTGLAVTDQMQNIAMGLDTIHPAKVVDYLKDYMKSEVISCFVIGKPMRMNNTSSELEKHIIIFISKLKAAFPAVKIDRMDERFTSNIAMDTMISAGVNKKTRRNKELIDKISATLILQSYIEQKQVKSERR